MGLRRPLRRLDNHRARSDCAHHRRMKMAGRYAEVLAVRASEVGSVWCDEPDQQLDPGCSGAPPIVAPSVGARRPDSASDGHPLRPPVKEGTAMEVVYERCCG